MKSGKIIWVAIFVVGIALRCTQLFHPVDTESWRESDVSTIAKNFYLNHTDIFHPQVAWDGTGPGYTEGEFQLYSYLIATTYKIVGFWEPAGRVISFIFSIAAMLIFFKISRFLLKKDEAIAAAICFAVSPILTVVANTIQPESLMFFFYLSAGYTFLRWLDEPSKKYLLLTIICTALALLCKLTAANIGIMFLLMILFKKGWKYFFAWQVILLGICSILPSILWYWYCHKFYINYGNSLGLSNEYAWIGMDFFSHKQFILGVLKIEIQHVWTKAGPFIVLFAFLFTQWRKEKSIMIAAYWYASAFILYLLAVRTTSADWAYYYHIFSIPSVCILIGTAVVALYRQYAPVLKNLKTSAVIISLKMKGAIMMLLLVTLVLYFGVANTKYFVVIKNTNFKTSEYYNSRDSLKIIIPEKSMFLANGGFCSDQQGYPKAYNNSYFFYWLNRKGYNICVEELSVTNIAAYKAKGIDFFVAEEKVIKEFPGLREQLKKYFITLYEKNGCIVFKL